MVKCKTCKIDVNKKVATTKQFEGRKSVSYFCSPEHLEVEEGKLLNKLKELENKQKFNELDLYIAIEILGNELGQIVNPYLKKRVKKLANYYDYEVIKMTFEYVKKDLHYYLNNKEFSDEKHKINYIMIIVENNINNSYKIWKRKKELELSQTKQIKNNFIKNDVMNNLVESNVVTTRKPAQNDILAFLDEEDL